LNIITFSAHTFFSRNITQKFWKINLLLNLPYKITIKLTVENYYLQRPHFLAQRYHLYTRTARRLRMCVCVYESESACFCVVVCVCVRRLQPRHLYTHAMGVCARGTVCVCARETVCVCICVCVRTLQRHHLYTRAMCVCQSACVCVCVCAYVAHHHLYTCVQGLRMYTCFFCVVWERVCVFVCVCAYVATSPPLRQGCESCTCVCERETEGVRVLMCGCVCM